jgi:glycine/D-amino acid oxidase-like deaminating enzyme
MTRPPPAATLPDAVEVVIVGAGVAGAATGRCLADLGVEPLLLERGPAPGRESSGRSADMVRQDDSDPHVEALTRRGAALHREERFGPFRRTGSLLIGAGDEDASLRHPWARGRARFVPDDGVTDGAAVLARLLAGLPLACATTVLDVRPAGGGLEVVTDRGPVRARAVVNAAGAWAGRLPRAPLPLTPLRRHLFRTTPVGADPAWPFVWDVVEGFYFRSDGDALLSCGCDEAESEPGDNSGDVRAWDALVAKARRLQPGLPALERADWWAGQRTFAPDRRFVIGWDPRLRGLLHAAALGGHGITAAPAVGELAARLVVAGPDASLPPLARGLSPARLR